MSLKANYFKLGLFVIGAAIAGAIVLVVIGSGRWFVKKITIETYFNESVQGLDVGSKLKYRGVAIGDVTRIGFTYNKYQLDQPMSLRARYVLVEAQIEPRLVGGRAGAGDLGTPEGARQEVARGLRIRLAAQGITGTSYLEIDYVEPPPPVLPIDWTPANIYIPSTPSTLASIVSNITDIGEKLAKLDINGLAGHLDQLLVTANAKIAAIDTKTISERTDRTLGKLEKKLDEVDAKKISEETVGLLAELRRSNAELAKLLSDPALQKLPADTAAAVARARAILEDPNLPKAIASLSRTLTRLDRIVGGGQADLTQTIDNLRVITDNLRDLTEEAKRYPANVLFGAPPAPLERKP
jgi:ABC-type transporter Mla subunit MlaD